MRNSVAPFPLRPARILLHAHQQGRPLPHGSIAPDPLGAVAAGYKSPHQERDAAASRAGRRHATTVLMEAGGWQDEAVLRDALKALAPKLWVIGLRICIRKAGIRMAKVR